METLERFTSRQVENGWIVDIGCLPGYVGKQYVFASLADLAEWLKVQVVMDKSRR